MSETEGTRKVAFYIRVSTERQAKVEEGSLKNQEQMLHAELKRRNEQHADWGLYVESYVDEGISGKDTNRPAFQNMLHDIEIGKINAVMFTELSRLSRSLKDFINIFEFAQKHECGLICLKTEIDTTSPYKSLITKILMIFAEFEREMTSRRTAINAYERSRRGLANGGIAPLGYKRDKRRKGHLLIEEKERKCVEEIFSTYLKEKSIKKTVDYIKQKYQGQSHRLRNITRSKIYTILTNKTYIAVREIRKRDKRENEEVAAAWKPIIDNEIFTQVQNLLKQNKDRFHAHSLQRYVYVFSGLFRCGLCGEKLQGKSAYSSTSKKHYYYSHKSTCPKGGLNRIDAELVHKLVFDWLKDISTNGKRFKELQEQGKQRLRKELTLLHKEQANLEDRAEDINSQIEARIRELIKTESEIVRKTIEQSIEKLKEQNQEIKDKRAYVNHTISRLEELLNNPKDLFKQYGDLIQQALTKIDSNNFSLKAKAELQNLIAKLSLTPTAIKTALCGVNRKGLVSTVFVVSPRDKQSTNKELSLIEDSIPLPALLQIRSKAVLEKLYNRKKLSVREIARLTNTSHSTILLALSKLGIPLNGNGHKRKGQIPFGFEYRDYKLIKSKEEQEVIRMIRQYRVNGFSLRKIAYELNQKLIPTKNCGIWQANTVRKIIERT